MPKYNNKSIEYDGLFFDSLQEASVYKHLKQAGFNPSREPIKYVIWNGFKPTVKFYNRDKKTKTLVLDNSKIRDITYTPDFQFVHAGYTIIIEVKGMENDVFPYKKKLFRKLLESFDKVLFFELGTIRQLKQAITIIKELENEATE